MTNPQDLRSALTRIRAAGDPARLNAEDHAKLVKDYGTVQSWCNADGLEKLLALSSSPAGEVSLPETTYSLFYEDGGDEDHGDEGCQYVLDEPGYTRDQLRTYGDQRAAAERAVWEAKLAQQQLDSQRTITAMAEAMEKDAERLNWMDSVNSKFSMGWDADLAPGGNLSVNRIIQLGGKLTTIREALDAARQSGTEVKE